MNQYPPKTFEEKWKGDDKRVINNWPQEKIRAKLRELKSHRDEWTSDIIKIDKQIHILLIKKEILKRRVSNNKKYSNKIVELLK
jgi:hypothetical protein